jgi:hypothetical protein
MNSSKASAEVRGEFRPNYPFTGADVRRAAEEWGCNCGPAALAFALQVPLERVRGAIPGFESKRYTSPTMMRAALDGLGVSFTPAPADRLSLLLVPMSLVRVQWTGPWAKPGAPPKWAYRQTHWIAAWGGNVFDVNGGIGSLDWWVKEIVPAITAATPRADGGWFPTHVWRITEGRPHA